MEIEVTAHGDITLVRLTGRIVDGKPADDLQAALKRLVRENKSSTIIDLEGVTWFDSLAIGILVSHYVSVTKCGGKVLLLKANPRIRHLMDMTQLSGRFDWASSLDDALARLERPPR